jgi:hypothetical protein
MVFAACGVQILSQGIVRGLSDDGAPKIDAFK